MRERPAGVPDREVLAAVRDGWAIPVERVEHVPVGFGAHHWRADVAGTAQLFVTLDVVGPRHSAASLESAYAAAAALAQSGLEFVLAGLAAQDGRYTRPFQGFALSCVPWRDAEPAGDGPINGAHLAQRNAEMLARLHAASPPSALPRWTPRVGPDLPDRIAAALHQPWPAGPYGERVRALLAARLVSVREWTARFHQLVASAGSGTWVPTHGEPHTRNQLTTENGPVLVDWESIALAPRERDFGPLVASGFADLVDPDWSMIEMFDLEWRLDEIAQYADWFRGRHGDTEDDRIAFAGLTHELERPEWSRTPAGS